MSCIRYRRIPRSAVRRRCNAVRRSRADQHPRVDDPIINDANTE
jgi:hypothetical protein